MSEKLLVVSTKRLCQPNACVNQTLGCVNQTFGCVDQTLGCINQTLGCVNQTLGCVNQTLGCSNQTLGCVNQTFGCINQTLGCVNQTLGCVNQMLSSVLMAHKIFSVFHKNLVNYFQMHFLLSELNDSCCKPFSKSDVTPRLHNYNIIISRALLYLIMTEVCICKQYHFNKHHTENISFASFQI